MTTSESKGRFFLQNESIRIDSHNEWNRFESRIGMLYRRPHNWIWEGRLVAERGKKGKMEERGREGRMWNAMRGAKREGGGGLAASSQKT